MLHKALAHAFEAWADATAESKETKVKLERAVRKMLNKQQAQKLAALLHSKEWPLMEEYLADLRESMIRAVVTAQSESELRQVQGKLALLEMLLQLKSNHEAVVKNGGR